MPDKSLDHWSLVTASLSRSTKTVMVLDLVESVRLMEENEADIVHRWQGVQRVVGQTLLEHHGRMVKSLGDGMMIEFDQPRSAVKCALAIQAAVPSLNLAYANGSHMLFRIGIHTAQVYADGVDIYGSGVNLAARLTTLAGPGEVVVSAELSECLTDGLDGELEDLGSCYLKHVSAPVRAYRIGRAGQEPVLPARKEYDVSLQPTIAVIPFEARSCEPEHFSIGELIADGVIGQLSRAPDFRVISRLSSTAFRGRPASLVQVERYLGADYVISGSYLATTTSLIINVELANSRSGYVMWADQLRGDVGDLLASQSMLIGEIVAKVQSSVFRIAVDWVTAHPLPTLASSSLMMGAITLMHRLSREDLLRSRKVLEHLVERHPRNSAPRAWLAKWYSLAIAQGWSEDPKKDTERSLAIIQAALEIDPDHALALTVKALIHGYVEKKFDLAQQTYARALNVNPSEPLAWIGTATLYTWQGQSQAAVAAAEKALLLSPLDPMKYYFDSLASTAMLEAGLYERAIELGLASLRRNRSLSATYKILIPAQRLMGQFSEAKDTAERLMKIEPDFTVEAFKRISPLYRSPQGAKYAAALTEAGIPIGAPAS